MPIPPTPPLPTPPVPSPFDFRPMDAEPTAVAVMQALLKQPGQVLHELGTERRGKVLRSLILLILVGAAAYGVVVGSLSGGMQLWAAPLKIAAGMFASILLCLPSLHIFLSLSGVDLKFGQVAGAFLGMVALITLLLIGFAPVAWIFSQSTDSVALMGTLHLVFWVIGLWFGGRLINGLLRGQREADRGHLRVWMIIFVLVSLQMTTALRPIIGTAPTLLPEEKKFFIEHWSDSLNR